MLKDIRVSCSPHISQYLSTRTIMIDVIIGLAPAIIAAGYYFRVHAVMLIATCIISAAATEWIWNIISKKPNSLGDFSAVVTGIILALSLPPSLPIWAAVIGSAFAIIIGKMVFGGLGANIFNPAMAGRAFLTASFGVMMTTWTVPATLSAERAQIEPDNRLKSAAEGSSLNAITQATPLALSKQAIKSEGGAGNVNAQTYGDELVKYAFTGEVGGCLGETSALALLLGGIYLLIRRTINFHIPAAVLLSAFVFAGSAYLVNPEKYVQPWFHLITGGMMLCAFFIATDPVTAPLTHKGMWIFGLGVGAITILIRIVGEYPEGVMFAVLLMNAVTPLIDRLCKRIPAGGKVKS
jgi:electron transport complex protein RnfD